MSTRARRLLLILPMAVSIVACGSAPSPSPSDTPTAAPPTPASEEPASAQPTGSAAAGQTDTAWGRIWDSVPAGFPQIPGSTVADDAGPEPASVRLAVQGDPQAIATWYQGALETATFSTVGLNGPGEDGGFVLDSVGDGECRLQTTIAPLGDTTFVTVLYGAACPAP
jgi:hypothetical protein